MDGHGRADGRAWHTSSASSAEGHQFTRLGVIDNGTPVSVTSLYPAKAAEWIRYCAGWAEKLTGETHAHPTADGELAGTLAQPYGVTPW